MKTHARDLDETPFTVRMPEPDPRIDLMRPTVQPPGHRESCLQIGRFSEDFTFEYHYGIHAQDHSFRMRAGDGARLGARVAERDLARAQMRWRNLLNVRRNHLKLVAMLPEEILPARRCRSKDQRTAELHFTF